MSIQAAGRLADVRAWWRRARPPRSLGSRLELLYVGALAAGTIGLLLYGTASSVLADWITPGTAPVWGPSLLLLALVVGGRWGTWQGPVVFRRADIGFLLGAPLPRSGLVVPRLAWALLGGAGLGVLAGAVALVGLTGHGRSVALRPALGLLTGLGLYGAMVVALAWAAQCSARVSRGLARLLPLVVALAAGMVLLGRAGGGGLDTVVWSGPWAWAVQPVGRASGAHWGVALALLGVSSALAGWVALRHGAGCSTERHALRAEAREGAAASLGALDVRSAQLALRRVDSGRPGLRRRLLPLPRRPGLALAWRDASALLRSPGRVVEAVLLGGAGAVLALTEADHFAAAAVAALLSYLALTRLLEPLRLEVDLPGASQILLLRPYGRVLSGHLAVPLAIVALVDAVAAAACAAADAVAASPAALAAALLASLFSVALCAAMSARRGGRLPPTVLFLASSGSDPSGGGIVVLGWLLAWPGLAAAIAGGATHLATTAHGLGSALILALAPPFVLAPALRRSRAS